MSVSLLAPESSSLVVPMKFCRSDNPMPSAPSIVATDSLVLCSDGRKEDSNSLVSSNVGFSSEVGLPPECGWGPSFLVWFESKSASVAGSIGEGGCEHKVNDFGGIGS
jgi:hypothetical protein